MVVQSDERKDLKSVVEMDRSLVAQMAAGLELMLVDKMVGKMDDGMAEQ